MLPGETDSWASFERRSNKPVHLWVDHMTHAQWLRIGDGDGIRIPHALWSRLCDATQMMRNESADDYYILEEVIEDWLAVVVKYFQEKA